MHMDLTVHEMPVAFVFGFPRSGTSWIGNVFNSCSNVIYRHEALGRVAHLIDPKSMNALKHNHGLAKSEYEEIVQVLVEPHPSVDRPPFFSKQHEWATLSLRKFLWLAATQLEIPGYRWAMRPRIRRNTLLVLKETGGAIHLESIIRGLAPSCSVLLLRHPCAVVSSHLSGVKKGLMRQQTDERRLKWYRNNCHEPFVVSQGYQEHDITDMSNAEFVALRWRIATDIILNCHNQPNCELVVYEEVVNDPRTLVDIFAKLQLDFDEADRFLRQSQSKKEGSVLSDARDTFYSVYRDQKFDPYRWRSVLDEKTVNCIKSTVMFNELPEFWPNA